MARCLGLFSRCICQEPSPRKLEAQQGPPPVQQAGVRQGCPLSPTLILECSLTLCVSTFSAALPRAGLQLGSGRCVPYLCYADDVVLMAESAPVLQQLIDVMHDVRNGMGLTISIAKTEVVVFHGDNINATWSMGGLDVAAFPVVQISRPSLS